MTVHEVYDKISRGMGAAFLMDADGIIAFHKGCLRGTVARCADIVDNLEHPYQDDTEGFREAAVKAIRQDGATP